MNNKTIIAAILLSISTTACCTAKQHPESLCFYCTFDDKSSILSPAIGNAGKIDNEPTFVQGKVGMAMQNLPEQRNAIFALNPGTVGDSGCIELWAKITNHNIGFLRDNGNPMLFVIRTEEKTGDNAEAYINWNGNDGSGGEGLCGWIAAGRFASGFGNRCTRSAYSGLLGSATGDWHHYAMSWDVRGLDEQGHQALIFVDNRVVATVDTLVPEKLALFKKFANVLNVPGINGSMQRGSVAIDELRIWNKPLLSFNLDQK